MNSLRGQTGPNPVIPPRPRSLSSSSRRPITVKTMVVGKASGKRTLAEAMDQDLAVKKKRQREHHTTTPYPAFSRFFSKPVPASGSDTSLFKSKNQDVGPSRLGTDKENECIVIQDDTDEEDLASHVANGCHDSKMDLDVDTEEDTVQQEDGYISPSPSRSCDTEELSSPPRPGSSLDARDLYEHDVLSSPSAAPGPLYLHQRSPSLSLRTPRSNFPADSSLSNGKVLVHASPEPEDKFSEKESFAQLDLRNFFSDDLRTEIDYSGDGSSTPSPSPLTPDDDSGMTPQQIAAVEGDGDLEINDPEVQELHASVMRTTAVAAGWRARWALGSAAHAHTPKACKDLPALRRRETNITPVGRHRLGVDFQLSRGHLHSGPGKLKAPDSAPAKSSLTTKSVGQGLKSRRSLVFFEHVSTSSKRVE
ncbi:hypothetical protein K435DRAFT_853231 [Dendrothele bispora CBS 962.96]|uniref:Uncharacterized protein n=1 Tax=Dendrothele bispora (strain CBS 962.96) TaxID=1314807 RepID=A0A4S8MH02_DENBC|nr:hypothetical protein K435DRAFT_853231 [Dendrothele bispora CBS 962.96]